jgi:hypothetical protein
MNCDKAITILYERYGDDFSLRERLYLAFHILFCGRCALSLRRLESARELFTTGFFPPSPDFEDTVMSKIYAEAEENSVLETPAGLSTRGWVVVGIIALVSLTTLFFGSDFDSISSLHGSSFLLPLGIMIGLFVTVYGSLFIGSHLKELSERFRLR